MMGIIAALRENHFNCFGPEGGTNVLEEVGPYEISQERLPLRLSKLETPDSNKLYIPIPSIFDDDRMLFRYFLDGSQRVTTAGYVIDQQNRYLPLLIAQIGVSVTRLDGNKLLPETHVSSNILFFPNSFSDEDLNAAKNTACTAARNSRMPLDLEFEKYTVDGPDDKSPMENARSHVLHRMHEMEIERIIKLATSGKISRRALLLIDGSLQFYGKMEQNMEAFRNVVGVAKSFDLQLPYGRGKYPKQVGAVISRLPFGNRTQALATKHRNLTIGSWYLRLHEHSKLSTLEFSDGVVKIEVFPDNPTGPSPKIESARCKRISQHVFSLRAPATPNSDSRWASHLYPIYLTERYIKTQFRSNLSIRACL